MSPASPRHRPRRPRSSTASGARNASSREGSISLTATASGGRNAIRERRGGPETGPARPTRDTSPNASIDASARSTDSALRPQPNMSQRSSASRGSPSAARASKRRPASRPSWNTRQSERETRRRPLSAWSRDVVPGAGRKRVSKALTVSLVSSDRSAESVGGDHHQTNEGASVASNSVTVRSSWISESAVFMPYISFRAMSARRTSGPFALASFITGCDVTSRSSRILTSRLVRAVLRSDQGEWAA
jgi:hypothetical protein